MVHDLIQRLKTEYSDELFEQLYRLYADRAIRTAAAVTGSSAGAADVVQETFIRVYRNLGSYDLSRPFEPWFNRILYNECNRYLKKHAKMVPSEISEERDLPPRATPMNLTGTARYMSWCSGWMIRTGFPLF